MIGRLPRSRSPPHPNTQMIRPARKPRSAFSTALERVRLVRVSTNTVTPGFAATLSSRRGPLGIGRTPSATASKSTPSARRQSRRAQDIEQIDFADERDAISTFLPEHRQRRANPAQVRVEFLGMYVERSIHSKTDFRSLHRIEDAPARTDVAAYDRDSFARFASRHYSVNSRSSPQSNLRSSGDSPRCRGRGGEHACAEVQCLDATFCDPCDETFRDSVTHALTLHLRQRRFRSRLIRAW